MENADWNHQYYNRFPSAAAGQSYPPHNGPALNPVPYGQPFNQDANWEPPFNGSSRSFEATAPLMVMPTHQQQTYLAPPDQALREQHLSSIGAVRAHRGSVHHANQAQGVGRLIYMPSTVANLEPNYPSALSKLPQRQEEIIPDRIEEPEEEAGEEEAASPMEGPALRISCPYYLKAPHGEHRSSACRGRAFLDISRLKDHLVKIHGRRVTERLTGRSTKDKWDHIWNTLFDPPPGTPIPDPHWTGIEACEDYVVERMKERCPGIPYEEVRMAFAIFKSRSLLSPAYQTHETTT